MQTKIYQLKITTKDIKPSIWRTILIPSTATFIDLHEAIIRLFGFDGDHLFEFHIGNDHYNRIGDRIDRGLDARTVKLFEKFNLANQLNYTYDFGDNWRFIVTLQKTLEYDDTIQYPHCIKAKGGMLIEDCGGSYAYGIIAQWQRNPNNETTDALIQLFGDDALDYYDIDVDPDKFDINSFNKTWLA